MLKVGNKIPEIDMQLDDGSQFRPADFRGKTIWFFISTQRTSAGDERSKLARTVTVTRKY